jgi:hypothetical protein
MAFNAGADKDPAYYYYLISLIYFGLDSYVL